MRRPLSPGFVLFDARSSRHRNHRSAAIAAFSLAAAGCSASPPSSDTRPAESLLSDRGALTLASLPTASDAGVTIDPRRSIIVTDQVITQRFSLQNVLDTLIAQSKISQSAEQLFHEIWDTQNQGPGLHLGPHCDDQKVGGVPAINGFPIECPRPEGLAAEEDPFADPNANQAFFATALVNRFDLAPSDGSSCGENRIIFARNRPSLVTDGDPASVLTGTARAFIIFEAVIPNPNRSLGLRGCKPVEQFWGSLSTNDDVNDRGSRLFNYYFSGLGGSSGVGPVLDIQNLGASDTRPTGQVRTNGFMQGSPPNFAGPDGGAILGLDGWMLKQFALRVDCTAGPCALRAMPRTVKVNPWAPLFNPNNTDATSQAFQSWFATQVGNLGVNDVNLFNYVVPDQFNAGQSQSFPNGPFFGVDGGPPPPLGPAENDYLAQFEHGAPNNQFRQAIAAKIASLKLNVTPEQIVARATALSCGGCHFISATQDLGFGDGGVAQFGNATPFAHVSETLFEDAGAPGQRQFLVSDALKKQFLPFRAGLLERFLAN